MVVRLNSCERKIRRRQGGLADYLINADKDDPVQAVMDLTNGRAPTWLLRLAGLSRQQPGRMAKNWGSVG